MKFDNLLIEASGRSKKASAAVAVEPKKATVADIAKKIMPETDGTTALADAGAAIKKAKIVKSAADVLGKDTLAVVGKYVGDTGSNIDTDLNISNTLTEVLDIALEDNKRFVETNAKTMANVLVIGLPGSSKTAVVKNWAHQNGLNAVTIDAKDNEISQLINGIAIPVRTESGDIRNIVKFRSKRLNDLDKPNSILILDELNRQPSEALRGSLLDLLNTKTIKVTNQDGTDGIHVFKNRLFAIVMINPAAQNDLGATKLNAAELGRMSYAVDFESTKASAKAYLNAVLVATIKRSASFMKDLAAYLNNPDCLDYYNKAKNRLIDAAYEYHLIKYFLSSSSLFRFSDRTDVDRVVDVPISTDDNGLPLLDINRKKTSYNRDFAYVSQREFTKLVFAFKGNLDDLIKRIKFRNFTPEEKNLILDTAASYKQYDASTNGVLSSRDACFNWAIKEFKLNSLSDVVKAELKSAAEKSAGSAINKDKSLLGTGLIKDEIADRIHKISHIASLVNIKI